MCGLIIYLNKDNELPANALDSLAHRGVESTANWITDDEGYSYGHIRLPIRGLSAAYNQPFMVNKHGPGVFVGEVFNLPGENDAIEAISRLQHEGPEAAAEFDGFFSVAYRYYDSLLVQTDHLGIKPLYYDSKHGIIASELRAIYAAAPDQTLDPLFFSNVLKWGYDMTGRTPFEYVSRVPPGTTLQFLDGELRNVSKYFHLEPKFHSLDIVLREAVSNRLLSDVPVATLCSGGLDSTIVTMLAAEEVSGLDVFHVENDEEDFFDLVPLPKSARVHYVKPETVPWMFSEALHAADLPVDLGSVVPQYALACALKQQGVNVVLTGDGADELFGGYRRAKEYDSQYSDTFHELPHYHLPRLDAIMMSQTIELRSPFLAPAVIEAALALPYAERTEKQALKKYFCDLVPREIIDRTKHPLKTTAVQKGGVAYRQAILDTWVGNLVHYGKSRRPR